MSKMFFKRIYVLHLMFWYFIQTSNALDFCRAFVQNGNAIDYSFGGSAAFEGKGFLIIDNDFWKLSIVNNATEVKLASNDSMTSTGFGKGYEMAFGYDKDIIGLVKGNNSIEFKHFSDGIVTKHREHAPSGPYLMELEENARPPLAFNQESNKTSRVIGLYDRDNKNFSYFSLPTHLSPENVTQNLTISWDNLWLPIEGYDVIAIFGPFKRPLSPTNGTTLPPEVNGTKNNESFSSPPLTNSTTDDSETNQNTTDTPPQEMTVYLVIFKEEKNIIKYNFVSGLQNHTFLSRNTTLFDCRGVILPKEWIKSWFLRIGFPLFSVLIVASFCFFGYVMIMRWGGNLSQLWFSEGTGPTFGLGFPFSRRRRDNDVLVTSFNPSAEDTRL